MNILGQFINGFYFLTDSGKEEIVCEVNNRLCGEKTTKYEDRKFESMVEFVCSNYNKPLIDALKDGLNGKERPFYSLLKQAQNERKLEQWFEAVARDTNLSGNDIMNYFTGDNYQQYVKKYGWTTKISGLSNLISKNVNSGCVGFLKLINPNIELKKQLKRTK